MGKGDKTGQSNWFLNKFRKKWEEHNGLGLIWSSVGFGLTEKIVIKCIKKTQLFTYRLYIELRVKQQLC